jgi:serine/threonine-protein phosphatase 2A catalytic subunit
MEAFDNLPVAATIENSDGKYLCVHAGLSPSLPTIDDINKFDRKMEVPKKGPLCDLVWSDPLEEGSTTFFSGLLKGH